MLVTRWDSRRLSIIRNSSFDRNAKTNKSGGTPIEFKYRPIRNFGAETHMKCFRFRSTMVLRLCAIVTTIPLLCKDIDPGFSKRFHYCADPGKYIGTRRRGIVFPPRSILICARGTWKSIFRIIQQISQ